MLHIGVADASLKNTTVSILITKHKTKDHPIRVVFLFCLFPAGVVLERHLGVTAGHASWRCFSQGEKLVRFGKAKPRSHGSSSPPTRLGVEDIEVPPRSTGGEVSPAGSVTPRV